MRLERRHALLLIGIALWNVVSYANFARNLLEAAAAGEQRSTGYWVAHTVLIVVNLAIAVVLGRLGLKAWKGTRADRSAGPATAGRSTPA